MHVHQLNGSSNYWSPYQWGGTGAVANATDATDATADTQQAAAPANPDQVSLSDAARALQAQDGGTGGSNTAQSQFQLQAQPQSPALSPDFKQEEQLLTSLADKSLAALGIISPADEAGTKVSFDALSYDVSSSTSVSLQSQQTGAAGGSSSGGTQTTLQFSSAQQATFEGEGHIVTKDGRDFTFQIELQVAQSEQGSVTTGAPTNQPTAATSAPTSAPAATTSAPVSASTNTPVATTDTATNAPTVATNAATNPPALSDIGTQILDALKPPPATASTDSGTPGSKPTVTTAAATNSAPATDAGLTINWDAILKQSKALFDLLDSLAAPVQPHLSTGKASLAS